MVCGEGDDQFWGSGRWTLLGAIAGCHCSVLWLGGAFFLYIDNTKLVFAIWGLCWYYFLKSHNGTRFFKEQQEVASPKAKARYGEIFE